MTKKLKDRLAVTLLEHITEPKATLIAAVYKAFQGMNFQLPISEWLIPDDRKEELFTLGSLPLMRVVANRSGGYELVAGFRTFVLAKACAIKHVNVVVLEDLDTASLLDHAIRDCIFFISMSCLRGSVATHNQVEAFINAVRKEMPAEFIKLLPKKNDVRLWLDLKPQSNRKLKELISPLEVLKQRADQAIAEKEEALKEPTEQVKEEKPDETVNLALCEDTKELKVSNSEARAESAKAFKKRTNRALAKKSKKQKKQQIAAAILKEGKPLVTQNTTAEKYRIDAVFNTAEVLQPLPLQEQVQPPFPKWNEICR